jgi:hypothetical protein
LPAFVLYKNTKAPKPKYVSTGGFSFTNFRKSSHDSLEEGRGYVVGLTWINRHEADSYRLGPKTRFLSRGIEGPALGKSEVIEAGRSPSKIWVYMPGKQLAEMPSQLQTTCQ